MITMFKPVPTALTVPVPMLCAAPAFADGIAPGTDILNTITATDNASALISRAIVK